MGYTVHGGVMAVGWSPEWEAAVSAFLIRTAEDDAINDEWIAVSRGVNGVVTLALLPSGSKSGWDVYARWASLRDEIIQLALTIKYTDWIQFDFGGDEVGPPTVESNEYRGSGAGWQLRADEDGDD